MEEKKKSIYFEPESSGTKKKKKEKEKNSEKNKKDNRWLKALVFLAFILIIVFATFWLLRGDSVTSGQYPENIREAQFGEPRIYSRLWKRCGGL